MRFLGFLTLVLAYASAVQILPLTAKAGGRITVMEPGVMLARQVASDAMRKQMKELKFDWTHKAGDDCTFTMKAEGAKVEKYEHPEFNVEFSPPTTIVWKTNGGYANISGEWEVVKGEDKKKFTGKFWTCMNNLEMNMPMVLDKTEEGKPTIHAEKCNFHFNFKESDIFWTAEETPENFKEEITGYLKKSFEDLFNERICKTARQLINKRAGHLLNNWPIDQQLTKKLPMKVDFSLVEKPMVGDNFISASVRGGIFWEGTEGTPFEPNNIPDIPADMNKWMMIAQATDYTMNSYMWTVHNHNLLKRIVTRETLGKLGGLLATTCEKLCIGKLSAEMAETYPDTFVHLYVNTKKPITFKTTKDAGVTFNGLGEIHAYIPKEEGNVSLIRAEMHFEGKMVNITYLKDNRRIHGEVKFTKMELKLVETSLSDVAQESMDKLAELAMKKDKSTFQATLDKLTGKGIPLPLLKGIKLIGEQEIRMQDGAIAMGTNLKFESFE